MKIRGMMKQWATKSAIPLVFSLFIGSVAYGQSVPAGDISRIAVSSHAKNSQVTAAGEEIRFTIRLGEMSKTTQRFELKYLGTGDANNSPKLALRMSTGGLAYLESTSTDPIASHRLNLNFVYTVREGDLAMPLTIKGDAGSTSEGNGFEFVNDDMWRIDETSAEPDRAVKYYLIDPTSMMGDDLYDGTMAESSVFVQTLKFNEVGNYSVPATQQLLCTVTRQGSDLTESIAFKLWSGDRTKFTLVGEDAEGILSLSIPSGQSIANFTIAAGPNPDPGVLLYLSDSRGKLSGNRTNFVTKVVTITEAPEPTVFVDMQGSSIVAGVLTAQESDNTAYSFRVGVTEPPTSNIVVKLTAPSEFIRLATNEVVIAKGANYASQDVAFYALNNPANGTDIFSVTPACADAKYKLFRDGKVRVLNVDPVIQLPTADAVTDVKTLEDYSFIYKIQDVMADADTTKITWSWGDGTTSETTGLAGAAVHQWTADGIYTVSATVDDGDGGTAKQTFSVTVTKAAPKPQFKIVLDQASNRLSESNGNNSCSFHIEADPVHPSSQDIHFKIFLEQPNPAVTNLSNYQAFHDMVLTLPGGESSSASFTLNVEDGTMESAGMGVVIYAVPTNAAIAAYYQSQRKTVYVDNQAPSSILPISGGLEVAYTNPIPSGIERVLPFRFTDDAAADLDTLVSTWDFYDDGTIDAVVTGAVGQVTNTFNQVGTWPVRITLRDKDMDPARPIVITTYVAVGNQPTIWIETSLPEYDEAIFDLSNNRIVQSEYLTIRLSSAMTYQVPITLTITPANSDVNGTLELQQATVVVPAGVTSYKVALKDTFDGTVNSASPGFTVTPSITDDGSVYAQRAREYFKVMTQSMVVIKNVAPKFRLPIAPAGDAVFKTATVGQGTVFSWNIVDSDADQASMKVIWRWNDGSSPSFNEFTGAQGSVTHIFPAFGEYVVEVEARDKDGMSSFQWLKVVVEIGQTLYATPLGPNTSSKYFGLGYIPDSLGSGTIKSDNASGLGVYENEIWRFSYAAQQQTAHLEAIPDAITDPTSEFNNFFYAWDDFSSSGVGGGSGSSGSSEIAALLNPTMTDPTLIYPLQPGSTGMTYQVRAVFSRELYLRDNVGDLNQDGLPDNYKYWRDVITAYTGTDPDSQIALYATTDLKEANPDGDVFPYFGENGRITVSNVNCKAFTALYELRGLHAGLNAWGDEATGGGRTADGGPTDGPLDEPGASIDRQTWGTDPTKADTDEDSLPDGYEYYFWYCSTISKDFVAKDDKELDNLLIGHGFNPEDVGNSIEIDPGAIARAFNPLVKGETNADTDGDGLTDVEEFLLETNPIEWDTDNDGIPDGWEVSMGLDPLSPNDTALTSNVDGDWMAYAVERMQFVTVSADGVDRVYVAKGAEEGSTTNGTFYSCYTYNKEFKNLERTEKEEVRYALGREVSREDVFADGAQITSIVEQKILLLHAQVYQSYGFDPRVAWGNENFQWDPNAENRVNTKPFTAFDEFMLCKYMANVILNQKKVDMTKIDQLTTNPLTPDSDYTENNGVKHYDGMPDGWELYIGCAMGDSYKISPWSNADGLGLNGVVSIDSDNDDLSNDREFGGTVCSAAYSDVSLYQSGFVSIYRDAKDAKWNNKRWPTDPWDTDTDEDSIIDGKEAATEINTSILGTSVKVNLQYTAVSNDLERAVIRGGGLNPCSVDTDRDGLPDPWEVQFVGSNAVSAVTGNPYIEAGMDPTHGANSTTELLDEGMGDAYSYTDSWVTGNKVTRREMDFDNDGLENYQEYMIQSRRHFRYDLTEDVMPMKNFDESAFFKKVPHEWDPAYKCAMNSDQVFWYMLPLTFENLYTMYVSTDPRDPDTDGDGMDDFYEMFHGLNPILGVKDLVALANLNTITAGANGFGGSDEAQLPMDFQKYPWLAGLPYADPDADGLVNAEEMLLLNADGPSASNTDPSPYWMTDNSYPDSLVKLYYNPKTMFFWDSADPARSPLYYAGYYLYTFEMNEGFDTDNDGVSDKNELITGSTSQTDPQDHDDPLRRQAMWFSGTNSVAETKMSYAANAYQFRSFTVELWARPEMTNGVEQVLLERPVTYPDADLSTTGQVIRVTFRIGIKADGRIYGMFQNAGTHDDQTGEMIAYGPKVNANEWIHIAARMDGMNGKFTLLINGKPTTTVLTSLIPATGVVSAELIPVSYTGSAYKWLEYFAVVPAYIVVGGTDLNKNAVRGNLKWEDYTNFYQGYIDEVRIWDGARTDAEILANYKKRFSKSDLLENRDVIAEWEKKGGTREPGTEVVLPAEIIYLYNFDNLFSADVKESVATAPRGFMDPSVAINRPEDYVVTWWNELNTHSTVYTNYAIIPWIENSVGHLPRKDGTVANSRLMGQYYAGVQPVANEWNFPNSNDPYGYWYRNDSTDGLGYLNSLKGAIVTNATSGAIKRSTLSTLKAGMGSVSTASDLLPYGDAWAKFVEQMWDGGSAASVWAETGLDLDSNGLPDWWEDYVATLFPGVELDWDSIYPDGSGMTAGHRYLRDIANGWTETKNPGVAGFDESTLIKQTSDADGDDLPDWWENLWGLSSNDATGDNGKHGDPDMDGLSNLAEYQIAEIYGFARVNPVQAKSDPNQLESDYFIKVGKSYLGAFFSDHDFMENAWEDLYDMNAVNRYVYDPMADYDQDGWSNWSEARSGIGYLRCDPTAKSRNLILEGSTSDSSSSSSSGTETTTSTAITIPEHPVPMIQVKVGYTGANKHGSIVVQAWHTPDMNGIPDAVWTLPADETEVDHVKPIGYYTADQDAEGWLSPGEVVPGSVLFKMTDMTTTYSVQTSKVAADAANFPNDTGTLYTLDYGEIMGDYPVGTIDYATGAYKLDLSAWLSDRWVNPSNMTPIVQSKYSFLSVSYKTRISEDFPKTLYLTDADVSTAAQPSKGYLREGMTYFHAFIDLDGNGKWSAGEPYGVADQFGIDVGWHRQNVNIELTDHSDGQFRFSASSMQRTEDVLSGMESGGGAGGGSSSENAAKETTVTVVRSSVSGNKSYVRTVFRKTLTAGRDTVTEADVLENGEFSLDWGLTGVPTAATRTEVVYNVYVGNYVEADLATAIPSYVFTNRFASTYQKAVLVSPKNNYAYAARPVFTWTQDPSYPAFELEIKNARGTTIYNSGRQRTPARDINGNCVWRAPVSVGNLLKPNGTYTWQVKAMNSIFIGSATGSGYQTFKMDAAAPLTSAGFGGIDVAVKYYGPLAAADLAGKVIVRAFHNADFRGTPESESVLSVSEVDEMVNLTAKRVNTTILGLPTSVDAGSYYVMAFVDQNENGIRDSWESWGYVNCMGEKVMGYDPKPVDVTFTATLPRVDLIIEDADSDQDWYPDAWEFTKNPTKDNFLELTVPNPTENKDTEINPDLLTGEMTATQLSAISTIFEVKMTASGPIYTTIPGTATSDELTISGLTISAAGVPTVQVSAKREGASLATAGTTVEVVLEFTESLSNPNWVVVETDENLVPVNGNPATITGSAATARSGFYRIRKVTK